MKTPISIADNRFGRKIKTIDSDYNNLKKYILGIKKL